MHLPSYKALNSALQAQKFGERISELHGFLCGALALDISYPLDTSIGTLAPDLQNVVFDEYLNDQLNYLYEAAQAQMIDPVLQLELLLPDHEDDQEDLPLSTRVVALDSWCDGFLFGLANAGLQKTGSLPENTTEILRDIASIAQLNGVDTGQEDEEVSYVELLEYVRIAVLLVAEELQPIKMTTEIQ